MMNNVKNALTRKFGPLPVWVYAIIGGVALYRYRNRGNKSQVITNPAQQPGVMDSQTPQDIVPLQPGESAYNPNTGQLVGTAPEQFPPADRPQPVTLEPGESLYDPATGTLIHDPSNDQPTPATKAAGKKPPKKKRKPKKKPHHKKPKRVSKHVPKGHHTRPRIGAHLIPGRKNKVKPKPVVYAHPRAVRAAAPTPARRPVARPATTRGPAVRQHVAPVRRQTRRRR